jgi:hypothetical protein
MMKMMYTVCVVYTALHGNSRKMIMIKSIGAVLIFRFVQVALLITDQKAHCVIKGTGSAWPPLIRGL